MKVHTTLYKTLTIKVTHYALRTNHVKKSRVLRYYVEDSSEFTDDTLIRAYYPSFSDAFRALQEREHYAKLGQCSTYQR